MNVSPLLTDRFGLKEQSLNHCGKVAGVAVRLGKALNEAGFNIDLDVLLAAGLLHDVVRSRQDHAKAGGHILREIGYARVADVVGAHMDISFNENEPLREKELLYLADKLVAGDKIINLNKRFQQKYRLYADNVELKEAIHIRLRNALSIKDKMEEIIGKPLETVLTESEIKLPRFR